jgi:hypothetical protein
MRKLKEDEKKDAEMAKFISEFFESKNKESKEDDVEIEMKTFKSRGITK